MSSLSTCTSTQRMIDQTTKCNPMAAQLSCHSHRLISLLILQTDVTVDLFLPVTQVATHVKLRNKSNSNSSRFPINNYLYPHNPLRGNPTAAKLGCPPHVFSRAGPGTLKSEETEDYILKARGELPIFPVSAKGPSFYLKSNTYQNLRLETYFNRGGLADHSFHGALE